MRPLDPDPPVTEFDLHAYADGRLDRDIRRREVVERHLEQNPEAAERVRAFMSQNDALTRLAAERLLEPVPDRLLAALNQPPPRASRLALRAAALAGVVCLSALGGWLAGSDEALEADRLSAFASEVADDYRGAVAGGPAPAWHPKKGAADTSLAGSTVGSLAVNEVSRLGAAPMSWLRQRVTVEMEVPDLLPEGYALLDSRRILLDEVATLRLIYRQDSGRTASLYMRPRWGGGEEAVQRSSSGGVTVLRWFEGPLAVALVADLPEENVRAVARLVRRSIARSTVLEPAQEGLTSAGEGAPSQIQELGQSGETAGPALEPRL